MSKNLLVLSFVAVSCLIVAEQRTSANDRNGDALSGTTTSVTPLSPEQEIELALKAGPVHLRDAATVYVFGANGYEKVRTGTNGFNCMVNRDGIQNGDTALHPT